MQAHVSYGQWGQSETWELGVEKGLLQGHVKRWGGSYPKKPQAPHKDFHKAFLKARWGAGSGGTQYRIEQFSDCLLVRSQGSVTVVNLPVLRLQEAWVWVLMVIQ